MPRRVRECLDTVHQRASRNEPGFSAPGFEQALELGLNGGEFAAFVAGLLAFDGEVTAVEPGVTVVPFEQQGAHGANEAKRSSRRKAGL